MAIKVNGEPISPQALGDMVRDELRAREPFTPLSKRPAKPKNWQGLVDALVRKLGEDSIATSLGGEAAEVYSTAQRAVDAAQEAVDHLLALPGDVAANEAARIRAGHEGRKAPAALDELVERGKREAAAEKALAEARSLVAQVPEATKAAAFAARDELIEQRKAKMIEAQKALAAASKAWADAEAPLRLLQQLDAKYGLNARGGKNWFTAPWTGRTVHDVQAALAYGLAELRRGDLVATGEKYRTAATGPLPKETRQRLAKSQDPNARAFLAVVEHRIDVEECGHGRTSYTSEAEIRDKGVERWARELYALREVPLR